jgi:hypothetical protein
MVIVTENQSSNLAPIALLGERLTKIKKPTTVGGSTIGIVKTVSQMPLTHPGRRTMRYAARMPVTNAKVVAITVMRSELYNGNKSIPIL